MIKSASQIIFILKVCTVTYLQNLCASTSATIPFTLFAIAGTVGLLFICLSITPKLKLLNPLPREEETQNLTEINQSAQIRWRTSYYSLKEFTS